MKRRFTARLNTRVYQRHTAWMRVLKEPGCAVGYSEHSQPSCAVGVSGSDGKSSVFGAPAERCGRDLNSADTVDCAYFAVRHNGSHEPGLHKVWEPAGEIRGAFLRSEHRTQMISLLRDCEHLAQPDDSARQQREQPKNVETD